MRSEVLLTSPSKTSPSDLLLGDHVERRLTPRVERVRFLS